MSVNVSSKPDYVQDFGKFVGRTAATVAGFEHDKTGLPSLGTAQQHASIAQEKEPHPFAELIKDVKPAAKMPSATVSGSAGFKGSLVWSSVPADQSNYRA